MKKLLILLITFTFASELEVQGNLKVTGNIDAQNNPITNVGMPQAMTDAVNAQTLNNILTDDGVYEYMFMYFWFRGVGYSGNDQRSVMYLVTPDSEVELDWTDGGISALNSYASEGWEITSRMPMHNLQASVQMYAVYELRRKIEE